jgi:hypothetical protein
MVGLPAAYGVLLAQSRDLAPCDRIATNSQIRGRFHIPLCAPRMHLSMYFILN